MARKVVDEAEDARQASKRMQSGLPTEINKRRQELAKVAAKLDESTTQKRYLTLELDGLEKELICVQEEVEAAEDPKKTRPCKRAVLVICDSINSAGQIEKRVRNEFPTSSVYRYDRAYRPFEKAKLDAGDIVIATNIAGRGTDLGVTKEVERNGGLHVIMAYMPRNSRVRLQGLGRTARAGNKGTGAYIVLSPGVSKTVQELMRELDDLEYKRILHIEREEFAKIRAEHRLFKSFNSLREELEKSWKDDAEQKRLQTASLLNRRAWNLDPKKHDVTSTAFVCQVGSVLKRA